MGPQECRNHTFHKHAICDDTKMPIKPFWDHHAEIMFATCADFDAFFSFFLKLQGTIFESFLRVRLNEGSK